MSSQLKPRADYNSIRPGENTIHAGGRQRIGRRSFETLLRWRLLFLLLICVSLQGLAKSVFGFPAFFEIVLVVAFGFSLGIWAFGRSRTRKGNILLGCLLAALIAIIASALANGSSTDTLYRGFYVYWLVPTTLVLLLDGRRYESEINLFTDALWGILVFNAVIALYRFLVDPTLGGYYPELYRRSFFFRAGDLTAESIIYGPTAALGAAFLVDAYLRSKLKRYLFGAVFVGLAALSALSRSGTFILFVTAIGSLVGTTRLKRMSVTKFALLAVLITSIGFGYLAWQPIMTNDAMIELGNYSDKDEYLHRFSTMTDFINMFSITELSKSLFGFGIGYFQPSTLTELDDRATFVIENFWLNVLGELGILGLAAIGAAYVGASISRRGSRSVFRWGLWSLLIVNMLAAPLLSVYAQLFTWSMLLVQLANERVSEREWK
jgi:hypothetical protein